MINKLIFLFIFYLQVVFSQTPSIFLLKSSDCLTTGPSKDKIISFQGSPWKATCRVDGDRLRIESIDLETGKIISKSDFEYYTLDKIGFASSESGNVKYLFDFKKMIFYHGQVNLVIEEGMVITKTCIGQISYK